MRKLDIKNTKLSILSVAQIIQNRNAIENNDNNARIYIFCCHFFQDFCYYELFSFRSELYNPFVLILMIIFNITFEPIFFCSFSSANRYRCVVYLGFSRNFIWIYICFSRKKWKQKIIMVVYFVFSVATFIYLYVNIIFGFDVCL